MTPLLCTSYRQCATTPEGLGFTALSQLFGVNVNALGNLYNILSVLECRLWSAAKSGTRGVAGNRVFVIGALRIVACVVHGLCQCPKLDSTVSWDVIGSL